MQPHRPRMKILSTAAWLMIVGVLGTLPSQPARAADPPKPVLPLPSRRIEVRTSGLDSIVAAEAKDRTRLVMNLDKLVPYDTRVDGNNIIVNLGGGNNASVSTGTAASAVPSRSAMASAGQRAIRSIDFRRSSDG